MIHRIHGVSGWIARINLPGAALLGHRREDGIGRRADYDVGIDSDVLLQNVPEHLLVAEGNNCVSRIYQRKFSTAQYARSIFSQVFVCGIGFILAVRLKTAKLDRPV